MLLKSDFETDISLFDGKMGLVLFFARYYRLTGNKIYERTADELMDQVIEGIHKELPIGLAKGLAGIGWGIEYLIQNGYLEGDSLDVCEEIDRRLLEINPERMTDLSLENGIEGILHYVMAHVCGVMKTHGRLPFEKPWCESLYRAVYNHDLSPEMEVMAKKYCDFLAGRALDYTMQIFPYAGAAITARNLAKSPLGLRNGLAGYLLNTMER